MRTLVSIFALTVLSFALVFTGPASRNMVSADTILAELCLDGVVQTVRLGPDGQPVSPNEDCAQGHTCCVMADDTTEPRILSVRTVRYGQTAVAPFVTGASITRIEYLAANPRAPPAPRIGQSDQTEIHS
ncbi:hypothetical protein ACG74X_15110 [Marivita sp. S0852]|uniref:hypothetical protein n=1 Tax=Marivita sp. S0852 TaxID=3373893 RepID=UPI003981C53B